MVALSFESFTKVHFKICGSDYRNTHNFAILYWNILKTQQNYGGHVTLYFHLKIILKSNFNRSKTQKNFVSMRKISLSPCKIYRNVP